MRDLASALTALNNADGAEEGVQAELEQQATDAFRRVLSTMSGGSGGHQIR